MCKSNLFLFILGDGKTQNHILAMLIFCIIMSQKLYITLTNRKLNNFFIF